MRRGTIPAIVLGVVLVLLASTHKLVPKHRGRRSWITHRRYRTTRPDDSTPDAGESIHIVRETKDG